MGPIAPITRKQQIDMSIKGELGFEFQIEQIEEVDTPLITKVNPDKPAGKAGLQAGMRMVGRNVLVESSSGPSKT